MAARQITFRAEPQIADEWSRFVKDSLIIQRYHLTCAVLLYMWCGTGLRTATQGAYARFRRQGNLLRPMELDEGPIDLSADELQLLAAHRKASDQARQEALSVMLRGATAPAATTDEPAVDSGQAGGAAC